MAKTTTIEQLELRLADARQLMEIHGALTGDGRGRRYDVDSLNRSAVMLAVAAWEAFVEDLAFRNAASFARRFKKAEDLPSKIRNPMLVWVYETNKFQSLSAESKDAIWQFAGNGWRSVYRDFAQSKVSSLNTPNSENVRKLFKNTLAINDITESWGYRRWGHEIYIDKLDALLKLRHKIAHGAITQQTVGKTRAKEAVSLVKSLGERSVIAVSENFKKYDLQGRKAKIKPA